MNEIYYVGATGKGSGRSLAAWVLAETLLGRGLRPGFVKAVPDEEPEFSETGEDPDLVLFRSLLGADRCRLLWAPKEAGSDRDPGKSALPTLEEGAQQIRKWASLWGAAIVMGSQRIFSDFLSRPVSEIGLIRILGAQVFLLDRYESEANSIYNLLSLQSLLKGLTRCLIVNRIPYSEAGCRLAGLDNLLLREQKLPTVAQIPEDPVLSSLSIQEIARTLPADLVVGRESAHHRICGFTLGSHHLTGPLRVFRQTAARILLLSRTGDNGQGAEHEGPEKVSAVLTAARRLPNPALVEAARQAGVCLLHADCEPFTALDRLRHMQESVNPQQEYKRDRFRQLLLEALGTKELFAFVGPPSEPAAGR
jgi:hypothetical protein